MYLLIFVHISCLRIVNRPSNLTENSIFCQVPLSMSSRLLPKASFYGNSYISLQVANFVFFCTIGDKTDFQFAISKCVNRIYLFGKLIHVVYTCYFLLVFSLEYSYQGFLDLQFQSFHFSFSSRFFIFHNLHSL